jgi:hypothetical protein
MPWVPGERPKPAKIRKCNGCGVRYNVTQMRSHKNCPLPIQERSPEGKRWYASLKKHKKAANARYNQKHREEMRAKYYQEKELENQKKKLETARWVLLDWLHDHPEERKSKERALAEWGDYFRPDHLHEITLEGLRDFLRFNKNLHWGPIHRNSKYYTDIGKVQECLRILLDENSPINARLDRIIPKHGPPFVKGLNKAVLTAIALCVYPDKYAVYNRRSVRALAWLDMYHESSESAGTNYVRINSACHRISKEINQPLELVDLMLGLMNDRVKEESPNTMASDNADSASTHDFLAGTP